MTFHVYIVVDDNDEILSFFPDEERGYVELEANPQARELVHAECKIISKELIDVKT